VAKAFGGWALIIIGFCALIFGAVFPVALSPLVGEAFEGWALIIGFCALIFGAVFSLSLSPLAARSRLLSLLVIYAMVCVGVVVSVGLMSYSFRIFTFPPESLLDPRLLTMAGGSLMFIIVGIMVAVPEDAPSWVWRILTCLAYADLALVPVGYLCSVAWLAAK
jgi:amino acid transporter